MKVKLIDFGCAVEYRRDGVVFGGTSEYMAPEVRNQGISRELRKTDRKM